MNILFIIDRIELKYFESNDLVTNFTLIEEFLNRGCDVSIATIDMLSLKSGEAYSTCYKAYLKEQNLFYEKEQISRKIEEFELLMFRPDPPVDQDYINATYILDFVDRNKTFIMNDTKAIRDFNEKLHAVLFKEFMPENIVTTSMSDIIEFLDEHNEIILKPLNKCFGTGVMYLKKGDKNTAVIINSMTDNGKSQVMVQHYIPAAKYGDKRVLLLGDEVLDVCIQKIPSNNDFKFNDHCDANIKKAVLSDSEKENFTQIAKRLNAMGINTAGLDVIDGKIIEVNVTSPCFFIREINHHFGIHLERTVVDFIFEKVKSNKTAYSL